MNCRRIYTVLLLTLMLSPLAKTQDKDSYRPKRSFIIAPSTTVSFRSENNVKTPCVSGNLMLAWVAKGGPYVKFGTNFTKESFSSDISSQLTDYTVSRFSLYGYEYSQSYAAVGLMIGAEEHFNLYLGPSYGRRYPLCKTSSGYIRDNHGIIEGLGIDIGMLFRFGKVGIDFAVNSFGLLPLEVSESGYFIGAELGVALIL